MDSMKRKKKNTVDDHILQVGNVQYVTGEEQRSITNSLRKNEVAGQKQ